jgi:hypothetical protein
MTSPLRLINSLFARLNFKKILLCNIIWYFEIGRRLKPMALRHYAPWRSGLMRHVRKADGSISAVPTPDPIHQPRYVMIIVIDVRRRSKWGLPLRETVRRSR